MLNGTDYEKLAICFRKGKTVLIQTGLIQIFNSRFEFEGHLITTKSTPKEFALIFSISMK